MSIQKKGVAVVAQDLLGLRELAEEVDVFDQFNELRDKIFFQHQSRTNVARYGRTTVFFFFFFEDI